ncbi:hypothetical protein QJQ45_028944 [Haematococcus lacustris]|nr:hypothetical protein QJQ45_028944 [Haematococcus lacustris]
MAEGSTLHIKFRTTNGDVGPLSFSDSQTVQQAKEKLWAEWPKEGPLSKEAPSSPNDIRLILGGKYVDAGKTLKEYRKDMGDIGLDSVVFFHMIVRPVPNPAKAGGMSTIAQGRGAETVVCLCHLLTLAIPRLAMRYCRHPDDAKPDIQRTLPAEGPLSKEAPSSPNDIRLILGGKYVDAGKTLKEYRKDMGDIGLDSVVFFHMIVRPVPNPAKAGGVYMVQARSVIWCGHCASKCSALCACRSAFDQGRGAETVVCLCHLLTLAIPRPAMRYCTRPDDAKPDIVLQPW